MTATATTTEGAEPAVRAGATESADRAGRRPAQALRRPLLWYRDPLSCLQTTFAAVVDTAGGDPLEVLGAGWEFRHIPGDVRTEEFYHPSRHPEDLGRSIAPHHHVRSRWTTPAADRDPLSELADEIAAGRLPIAAVDNFHLPFRPAYHDVHAAHLIVVYGVDLARGLVLVSDAQPPAFTGPIRAEDFLAAWGSANPADDQDAFFSATRIDRRYLRVEIGDSRPLDRDGLRAALRANVDGFTAAPASDGGAWTGLAGLRRYLDEVVAAAAAGDSATVRDVYPFGWSMQAQACLHGELLRTVGVDRDLPCLREAGRAVEAVGHTWSGLRVTAAHGWPAPQAAAESLEHHGARLQQRYQCAVEAVDRAVGRL
ncbi:BtrH N-terminal domain-containing protein [Micromonospora marina]|uniref:BtrH N-terminal domain-containing protein n=1 Tax=Micromonospora marina TaxID=307120 RepID=UPI003D72A3F5